MRATRVRSHTLIMKTNSPASRRAPLIVVGALAIIAGLLAALWLQQPAVTTLQSGTLLPQPRVLPAFSLTDQDGQAFGPAQLQGHWTLIFPGFTSCPDICPTTLAMLKNVEAGLGEKAANLRVAMFSVDPERDTPARLKVYVQSFSPRFIGFTAAEPQLGELARALGVAYVRVPGATPDSYTMDHSAALILVNPQGQLAGYLTPPFDPAKLGADLAALL